MSGRSRGAARPKLTAAASAGRRGGADRSLDAFVAGIASVPASELRTLFNYVEPFTYKPHTSDLVALSMELDDVQVLRYLFRNARPQRHLEFGTWEGRSALACLEECEASVWTINLRDGEERDDGSSTYGRVYQENQQGNLTGHYHVIGSDEQNGGIIRSYRTDGRDFIGHYVHSAGLGHRLCQIYADSRAWDASVYPKDFFDSVLIDGGHDRDTVINDTRKALARLRPGGLVIWHDFCPEPSQYNSSGTSSHGVVSALAQIWDEIEPELTTYRWVEGTWLLVGMHAGEPAAAPRQKGRAAATRNPRSQSALLESGIASIHRELDTLAAFHEEREKLNDALMRSRSENAALEKRLSAYASIVQERDLLVARHADLIGQVREGSEAAAERDALQREAYALKSRIAELERRVDGWEGLSAERDRLASALRESETNLDAARWTAADLEERIRHAQDGAAAGRAEIDALQAELASRRREYGALAAERDDLHARLSGRDDRIARIETEARERDAELIALRRDGTALSAAAAESEERLAALDARAARLSADLAERTQELESQRQALSGHNRQSEALAAELEALRETHVALEARHADLRGAHDMLGASNATMREAQGALERDNETLRRERARADADARQSRFEVELRAREAAALESRVNALNGMVRDLQAARDELARALAERSREVDARTAEIAERDRRIGELERGADALREALAQGARDRAALTGELAGAREALATMEEARRNLAADLAHQKAELARLSAELAARATQLADTDARIAAVEAENRTLQAARDSLVTERVALAADLGQRSAEVAGLATQRDALLADIDRQHRSLAAFDRVLAQARLENEDLRAAIDDYTHSNSWRITAPLRKVSRLFRR